MFGGGEGIDMRTLFAVLAVCLPCVVVRQAVSEDEKYEQKERDELKKELARIEPELEKTEDAVKRKQFIAELTKHLEMAERIDVLRLNSQKLPKGKAAREFHGHEILSEAHVEPADRRKEMAAFLGKTLHWNVLREALCFDPHHGLRAVSGKRTVEFLICFSCFRVDVFDGGERIGSLPLDFTDKDHPIEKYLADAEKQKREMK